MARRNFLLPVVLACIAMLASSDLHAQARGPRGKVLSRPVPDMNDPAQRAEMIAKLDTWLRRLVGKFRYEGFVQFGNGGDERLVTGTQDCWNFGEGPGLLCLINMTWPFIGSYGQQGPSSYWDPALALYGIGPSPLEINFMQLDRSGQPEGIPARMRGSDVVRFQVPCTNEATLCRKIVKITVGPDGGPIQMKIDKWGNYFGDMTPVNTYLLSLHRVADAPAQ
jgi:hypothetical protein